MIKSVNWQTDIVETMVQLNAPIEKAQNVYVVGYSVSFVNNGESDVIIDGKKLLRPGSSWMVGNGLPNMVFVQAFQVKFEGAGINRLEVEEQQLKGCDYSNYVQR